MPIERLAYLGFGVEDPQAWLRFAVDGLGLTDAGESGGAGRLRFDERAWRIALHRSRRNDILYAGFEVADAEALEELESGLSARGIEYRRLSSAEVESRAVRGGIAFSDPDGLAVEVVYGHGLASEPARPRLSFLTGEGGLGHFVLCVSDADRSAAFYRSLGFRITDFIDMSVGPEQRIPITFLHCNPRHHTLAIAELPLPRKLEHFMLEVATVDEVIDTYNRLRRLGHPVRRHLGRHPNDRMLSFYAVTPAGFDVEIGCDGVQVGEEWTVRRYDTISLWGHESED